ncbi:hypothetical protein CIPAW_14G086600 [Carya illinoinensis]|uniref:Uncharacterized protein n=1 Tax=Carya illinoinensis TaxID=32201 RepID=A0A8T1NI49_CARIL|nr:hypothetical protein CIPAW_14G086600 [Carya illinoinensis]
MFLVWMQRTSRRPTSSGIPMSISLSNRPNLLKAGSMLFGRFVAPNDNNMCSIFRSIHKSQKLRNYSTVNFTLCLLPLRSNRITLINENNGWSNSSQPLQMPCGDCSHSPQPIDISYPHLNQLHPTYPHLIF